MSALGKVVRSGVGRRRVQTTVMALVTLVATASAVLGGTLLVASHAPFDRAFAQQNGAHLTAQFDAGKATEAELAATADTDGVTATAGPFPIVSITPTMDGGNRMPAMTVAGRDTPAADVDDVTVTEGRWANEPGEIVLAGMGVGGEGMPSLLGEVIEVPELPGSPELEIVGTARTVSETAGAWVVPEQVDELRRDGEPDTYQMLYRFDQAATKSQLTDARDAVAADLETGAMTGSHSWLTTRKSVTGETALLLPFLTTFGVLGMAMAVLIVGNIVTGSVGTSIRRIGVLKALGFTPGQVVRAFMARALIPAGIGAGLGVVAGNLLARPVLAETNRLYGTSDTGVAWWVDALAVAAILLVVTVTAWAAALRAGRLRTVDALAVGRADHGDRGRWAARFSAMLPVPRSVSLGLAQPFARPGRAAAIVAAIAFGAAAVTFSVGLGSALGQIQDTQQHGDLSVYPAGPADPGSGPGKPPEVDAAAVASAISESDGADGYSGIAKAETTVAGITTSVEALGFTGTTSQHGYRMVDGDWFDTTDEIVVATPFLTATDSEVGDTITLTSHGKDLTVRIVGEVFNTQDRGMQILTDLDTLAAADPELEPTEFHIVLESGTDPDDYAAALNGELKSFNARAMVPETETEDYVLIINSLTALLTILLIAVAAMGVLNTVVLETRERVRDIGVGKALGMVPRQTVAMVLASVAVTGLIGGALGVPAGVQLQRMIVTEMGAGAGFRLPESMFDVYSAGELALFTLGGLAIAVAGALLPAGWAAKTRTATALRAE